MSFPKEHITKTDECVEYKLSYEMFDSWRELQQFYNLLSGPYSKHKLVEPSESKIPRDEYLTTRYGKDFVPQKSIKVEVYGIGLSVMVIKLVSSEATYRVPVPYRLDEINIIIRPPNSELEAKVEKIYKKIKKTE